MGFSKFLLHPVTFTRVQKWSMVIFTKYYWVSRESNFFNCWGDELVFKQMSNNNFATVEQIFTIFSGNMRPMPG